MKPHRDLAMRLIGAGWRTCLVLAGLAAGASRADGETMSTYTNPLDVPVADPCVFLEDGVYYLYGTYEPDPHRGITVFTSTNLVEWTEAGLAFVKSDGTWSQTHFWGAEAIRYRGRYLLYYTASPERDPAAPLNMFLCVAEGESLRGPFREIKAPLFPPAEGKQAIDQNVFVDDDGRAYLYFTYVEPGRNVIYAALLAPDRLSLASQPRPCIAPEAPWESRPWNGHRVAEGAHVLKHKGTYYMFYTANHFLDQRYAVGFATADRPLGPWHKAAENPILQRTDRVAGPGNPAPIRSPDGTEWFLLYHVHHSLHAVAPRQLAIDRFQFVARPDGPDVIRVDGPTHTPQPMPGATGTLPD